MAIKDFFRKRRLKKPRCPDSSVDQQKLCCGNPKESSDPASADTGQVLFNEQETTKKLRSASKTGKKQGHAPSIFII